jgi:hypothetical protein
VLFLLFYYRRSLRDLLKLDLFWTATSSALAFLYYKLGVSFILKFSDVAGVFAFKPRNPLQSLMDVFGDLPGFLIYLNSKAVYWGGTLLVLGLIGFNRTRPEIRRLILIFTVSCVFVVALDGAHSIIHDYYYVGVSFSICLIIFHLLFPLQIRSKAHEMLVLLFFVSTFLIHPLELLVHDFRGIGSSLKSETYEDDCVELKKIAADWPWNRNFVFRSEEEPYPKVGVCFGERVGSKTSPYGLFLMGSPLPSDCTVAFQKNSVILARCQL